jgi:hypothetical protein
LNLSRWGWGRNNLRLWYGWDEVRARYTTFLTLEMSKRRRAEMEKEGGIGKTGSGGKTESGGKKRRGSEIEDF